MARLDEASLGEGGGGGDGIASNPARTIGKRERWEWLRALIRRIDLLLQRIEGIREYSADERCLFRIALHRVPARLEPAGLHLRPGDPILDIHLWNEHIPKIAPSGPDFAWAKRFRRRAVQSMRQLAAAIAADPELRQVRAIRARWTIATAEDDGKLARVIGGIGFRSLSAADRPVGFGTPLGRFLNGVWALALVWTFNPHCLHHRTLSWSREEFWISRGAFLERFGSEAPRKSAIDAPSRLSPLRA